MKILSRWVIFGLLTIFGSLLASAAEVSDLFGTWDGTWFVDEKYRGLSSLSPPFNPAAVKFNIGPFDPIEGNYGSVSIESALSGVISSISVLGDNVELMIDYPAANFEPSGTVTGILTENTIIGDFDEVPTTGWITWNGPLEISKISTVPVTVELGGTIKTADGADICAMVLASGQFMFSCNPNGVFSLTDLPREKDGTVKRQIYADGFFPKVDTLFDSIIDTVFMTRSGTCPSYNTPYDPGVFPDSAGKQISISGKVLSQNSQTPICAMVLSNGQYMFSCDGTGSYALNIPLDTNGQHKLQVYADGFAPTTQTFDEFQAINDVRMARAAECQPTEFSLKFPLLGKDPYSTLVTAVMDHDLSCNSIETYKGEKGSYTDEDTCLAYDSDLGNVACGAPYPTGSLQCSNVPPESPRGYRKDDRKPFATDFYYDDFVEELENTFMWYDNHRGYDYAVSDGTVVLAAAGGTVTDRNDNFGQIEISHPNGYKTYYTHMRLDKISVVVGDTVVKGQTIGGVGSTGAGGAVHLHFVLKQEINGNIIEIDPYGKVGNYGAFWEMLP